MQLGVFLSDVISEIVGGGLGGGGGEYSTLQVSRQQGRENGLLQLISVSQVRL